MKLLGSVMIVISGLCMGLRAAGKLQKREEMLVAFLRMLQTFRTGMSYSARPLTELAALDGDCPFCRLALLEPGFSQNPKAALLRAGEKLLQNPGDRDLYRDFVRGLGESGAQSQMEHLALCEKLAENNLRLAREDREKRSRLTVCLGLFGGVTLCLVLL